jgi:toxin ParE1/3/4
MVRLTYRPAALADLDAIYDFIEMDSPSRALDFVQDIRSRCRKLIAHPQIGPPRDDLGTGIRIYPMRGRIVVYRLRLDAIEILRVF